MEKIHSPVDSPMSCTGAVSGDVRDRDRFPLVGASPGSPEPGEGVSNKVLEDKFG